MNFFKNLLDRFRSGAASTASNASSKGAKKSAAPKYFELPAEADWIVVGLGNPGARYAATRHNVGYMAVDDLLAETGELLQPVKGHKVHAATLEMDGQKVLIARTTTFMNLSGDPIAPIAQALNVPAERIIVIHDELDLPENKIRLKLGGNENGHNGLKSLSQNLGTRDYVRVRIGIARPPKGSSIPDYVLGPVNAGAGFDDGIALAAQSVKEITASGLNKAQNTIHSKG
ncbi:MAG: aminoacyl-tRNA hydrolase [Corynebacterium sp.]|uniref:aminoacyl-tRNA hydrolase n=1 Tax=Corynebacterium sp. TaxID=1720 RepID=UPI00184C7292|nr:aminoacyl-tRNA hydrolase [Corynebacterium sp.]NWO17953.1 aminoacyl-tRNA hydrolase [Corynebacterium sp.]